MKINQDEKNEPLIRKYFGYFLYQVFFSYVIFTIKSLILLTWL